VCGGGVVVCGCGGGVRGLGGGGWGEAGEGEGVGGHCVGDLWWGGISGYGRKWIGIERDRDWWFEMRGLKVTGTEVVKAPVRTHPVARSP